MIFDENPGGDTCGNHGSITCITCLNSLGVIEIPWLTNYKH